ASVLTTIGLRWIAGYEAKRTAEEASRQRDHDRELSQLADERSLRDAKRERLRRDYEDLAFAATEIQGSTLQLLHCATASLQDLASQRVEGREDPAPGLGVRALADRGRTCHVRE